MTADCEIPPPGWKDGQPYAPGSRELSAGEPVFQPGFIPDEGHRVITDDGDDLRRPAWAMDPELIDLEARASTGDKEARAVLLERLSDILARHNRVE